MICIELMSSMGRTIELGVESLQIYWKITWHGGYPEASAAVYLAN